MAGGQFVTTVLTVRTSYLQKNPDIIEKLVRAHIDTTVWIKANTDEAKKLINQNIQKVTGAGLSQAVIDAAWLNQDITYDPISTSLKKSVDDASKLGFLDKKPDLSSLIELTALNRALRENNLPEVKGL